MQQWCGLSDEGVEDAPTDSQALRAFVRIDLSRESAPDPTILLQFRQLLAKHERTKKVFASINDKLFAAGLTMRYINSYVLHVRRRLRAVGSGCEAC